VRVKLFTFRYSATLGGFDESALQAFVRDKEVLAFREHFFCVNEVPHLVCVLTWQDAVVVEGTGSEDNGARGGRTGASGARPEPSRGRGDPTRGLDEPQRLSFNALREWRSAKAHEEGVPPFLIFTNRQLVEIVRSRPDSPNALSHLHGIGTGKVKRYGAEVLSLLRPADRGDSGAECDDDSGGVAPAPDEAGSPPR